MPIGMATVKQTKTKKLSVGKDTEKLESLALLVRMLNVTTTAANSMTAS